MRKNPVLLLWKRITKQLKTVPLLSHPNFPKAMILLLLASSIPLTVFVAQQQQEVRQRAETVCSSANIGDEIDGDCINKQRQKLTCTNDSGDYQYRPSRLVTDSKCENVPESTWNTCASSDKPKGYCSAITGKSGSLCNSEKSTNAQYNADQFGCYVPKVCTSKGGTCSVACNSTDSSNGKGEGECSDSQYCCVPRKTSCETSTYAIEYRCDKDKKQLCFLDLEFSQRTSCLWNETDAVGGAGYHCEPKYVCDNSCLQKISCFTDREKCIRNAFSERDQCYNDMRKTQAEREACSNKYLEKINNCRTTYNDAKCADKVESCYGNKTPPVQSAPPTTRSTPTSGGVSNPATPTPVSERKSDPTPTPKKNKYIGVKPAPGCTPGEVLDTFNDLPCPNGKKGTCGGHSYCEWQEDGNMETAPICETAKDTCFDENASNNTTNSCKDNPTSPPDGYTWKQACSSSCSSNDNCPKNKNDNAVNPETSNWCYNGKCLMLVSTGNNSNNAPKDEKKPQKKDNKKDNKKSNTKSGEKDTNGRGNGKGSKSGNESKNLSNQPKNSKDKSDRDKAQKPIDKINKDRFNQGLPTLTPLPPDNGAYEAYLNEKSKTSEKGTTSTPSPTPQPPLAEPTNWQAICGPTTNASKPLGIRFSWNAVSGASRYAVRIDEDAPSWEGDTPSPGDTVDNTVKETAFVRTAKVGSVYQLWVHSVNASGVYSAISKKILVKCPSSTTNPVASSSAGTVGAGQLIVLP